MPFPFGSCHTTQFHPHLPPPYLPLPTRFLPTCLHRTNTVVAFAVWLFYAFSALLFAVRTGRFGLTTAVRHCSRWFFFYPRINMPVVVRVLPTPTIIPFSDSYCSGSFFFYLFYAHFFLSVCLFSIFQFILRLVLRFIFTYHLPRADFARTDFRFGSVRQRTLLRCFAAFTWFKKPLHYRRFGAWIPTLRVALSFVTCWPCCLYHAARWHCGGLVFIIWYMFFTFPSFVLVVLVYCCVAFCGVLVWMRAHYFLLCATSILII